MSAAERYAAAKAELKTLRFDDPRAETLRETVLKLHNELKTRQSWTKGKVKR